MSSTVIPIRHIVIGGLLRENVVTVRLLALCPMLAVSVSLTAAMTLGVLTLTVMALAGFCVSWVRVLCAVGCAVADFFNHCGDICRHG